MGNSYIQEAGIGQGELELFRHSSFYGRHEIKDGKVVKKYEVPEDENQAFLGLIQSYQKVEHASLISIEGVSLVSSDTLKHHYEICFPLYAQTLASELMARKRAYSEKEVARLILDVGEGIRIFKMKQFPYGLISPEKIAVRELHQGYCIGIDILMNPHSANETPTASAPSQQFLSPQRKEINQIQQGFNQEKSTVYSLGLIALKCAKELMQKPVEQAVFELRSDFSFQFCNLLEAMLQPQNYMRISLNECLEACRTIYEQENTKELGKRAFIRGYNCVNSLWLFNDLHDSAMQTRWKGRYTRK